MTVFGSLSEGCCGGHLADTDSDGMGGTLNKGEVWWEARVAVWGRWEGGKGGRGSNDFILGGKISVRESLSNVVHTHTSMYQR